MHDTHKQSRAAQWLLTPFSNDGGKLLLRLWLGSMMVYHGYGKVFGGTERLMNSVADMGFPAPEFFAWAAALSEFGGGLFLILGLLTRPTGVFVAITMAVAAFIRHSDDPFGKKELALTYLALAIALILFGAGRWSVDRFLFRKK